MNKRRRYKAKRKRAELRRRAQARQSPITILVDTAFQNMFILPPHEDCDCMDCRPWTY